jgi:hypothetical protein
MPRPVQNGGKAHVRLFDFHVALMYSGFIRWRAMIPLRQFKGVPSEVVRKAEGKQFVSPLIIIVGLIIDLLSLAVGSVFRFGRS